MAHSHTCATTAAEHVMVPRPESLCNCLKQLRFGIMTLLHVQPAAVGPLCTGTMCTTQHAQHRAAQGIMHSTFQETAAGLHNLTAAFVHLSPGNV